MADYAQLFDDPNVASYTAPAPTPADYATMASGPAPSITGTFSGPTAPPTAPDNQPALYGRALDAWQARGQLAQPDAFGSTFSPEKAGPRPLMDPTFAQPTATQVFGANPSPPPATPAAAPAPAAPQTGELAPFHKVDGGAGTRDAGQPQLGAWGMSSAGGGGGPNPLIGDLKKEKDITERAAADAGQEQAGLEGMQQHFGDTQQANADEASSKADKDLQDQQGQIELLRQQQEAAQAFHIDPNRYMKKQSFLQTGLLGVAAALNSVSKAFLHQGGPNEVMQQLNTNIERDIDAQKQDYEQLRQKGQDAQNLYAMNLKATGNHDQALALSKAQGLEAQKTYMATQAARIQNVDTRKNAELAGNAIDQKIDQYKQQAAAAGAAHQAAQAKELQDRSEAINAKAPWMSPAQARQYAIFERTGVNPDPRVPLASMAPPTGFNKDGEKLKSGSADKAAAKQEAVEAGLSDLTQSAPEAMGTDISRLSSHSAAAAQEDVREGKMITTAVNAGVSPRLAKDLVARFKPATGDSDEAKGIKMAGFQAAMRAAAKAPPASPASAEEEP